MPKQIFQRPVPVPRNQKATSGKAFGQPSFGRKKGTPPAKAKPATPVPGSKADAGKD